MPRDLEDDALFEPPSPRDPRRGPSLRQRAREAASEEIPQAMWMAAARKAIERSSPALTRVLLKSKILPASSSSLLKEKLATPLGGGLYGLAAGTLLSAHPRAAQIPWLGTLAYHMRLEGMARVASVLIDPMLAAVEAVLLSSVRDSGIDETSDP